MYWKYEKKYNGKCFDLIWDDYSGDPCIKRILEEEGYIKINHEKVIKYEFFKLLKKWHENKWIKPK